MTDLTIDQLTSGHSPDGSEPIPSVQGGLDVKLSVAQLATYAVGTLAISAASIAGNYTGGPSVPTALTQPQALALLALTYAAKTNVDNAFSVAQTVNGSVPSVALTATNIGLGGGQANIGSTLWVGLDANPGGRARSGFFADLQSSTAAFRVTGLSPGVVALAGNEIIAGSGTLRAGSTLMAATVIKVGYDASLGDGFYGYWDGNGIHGPTGSGNFYIRQQSSQADLQFIGYSGTILARFNNVSSAQYLEVGGNDPLTVAGSKTAIGGGVIRNAGSIYATTFIGAGSSLTGITSAQVGAEPALGNPASNGYVLSSTTSGTRSWVPVATSSTYPLHASGERLVIFYADLTSVNGFTAPADIAHFFCDNFDALVLVDGLWDSTAGAVYTQALAVCTEIKRVRPDFVLIGYIHTGETVLPVWSAAQLEAQVDAWAANLFCDGIFMDECEYGFHTPRTKVNAVLTYIQGKTTAAGRRMFGLVNCWNQAELLAGSGSIYDATYNPTSTPVSFMAGDALFHESMTYHYAFVSGSGLGYDNYISAAFLQTKETPGLTLRNNFGLHYYGSNLLPTTGGSGGGGTPLALTYAQFQQIWQDCASGCRLLGADAFALTYEGYSGTGSGSITPRSVPVFQRSASFNYRRDPSPLVTWTTATVGGTPTVISATRSSNTYTSYYPVGGPAIHSFVDPDAVSGSGGGGGGGPSTTALALLFTNTAISTAEPPSSYSGTASVTAEIKTVTTLGLPTATDSNGGVITLNQWTDATGGHAMQIGWSDAGAFWRTGVIASATWAAWNPFGLGSSNAGISTVELPSAYNTKTAILQVKQVSTLGITAGADFNGGLLTLNQWDSSGGSGLQVAWNDKGPFWRTGTIGGSSWTSWYPMGLSPIVGLTPGSYTHTALTVDAYGRITAAANGGAITAAAMSIVDTRSTSPAPLAYTSYAMKMEFKSDTDVGLTSVGSGFTGLMTLKPWNDATGGYATQLAFNETGIQYRQAGNDAASWGTWNTLALKNVNNSFSAAQTIVGADLGSVSVGQVTIGGGVGRFAGDIYVGGVVSASASTTSLASLRIPHGSAPTSPVNGDMWTTTAGSFEQINGMTFGPRIYRQWVGLGASNTVTTSGGTTFTFSSGTTGSLSIPVAFWATGRVIRIRGSYRLVAGSTAVFGAINVGIPGTLYSSLNTAQVTSAVASGNFEVVITCITSGASGTLYGTSRISPAFSNDTMAPTLATGVGLTGVINLVLSGLVSTVTGSPTLTIYNPSVELIL